MAAKEIGFLHVGASQFGTAAKQVYTVPSEIASEIAQGDASDPFCAARLDVAARRHPFDTSPFVNDPIPLVSVDEISVPEPSRERRIVIMKKRG